MTTLLLDVGNSRLKWGIAEDGVLRRSGHIDQAHIREQGLNAITTRLPRRIDVAFASNVAGASYATRLAGLIGAHCDVELRFARSEKRGWGVTNAYRQARKLGVDRWVAMVAAFAEVQGACLVVDAGTALTLDALDDDGQHLGGQIIPGAATMLASLSDSTADLPNVAATVRKRAAEPGMFGRNTAAALREGAQNAVAGAVERALRALQSSAYEPQLVLTGGGAKRILATLDEEALHRPNLVLQGLLYMLEHER